MTNQLRTAGRFARLALAVAMASASGCATTSDQTDDLDVEAAPSKESAGLAPLTSGGAGAPLPKDAVTNWQSFFKPPPSSKERHTLEQKLEKWPDTNDAKGLVAKGRAEVALGRYTAAEATFRQALRLTADDLHASLELAILYLRKKDVESSFELLSQVKDGIAASDEVPKSFVFRYRYVLAQAYLARGDRTRAHKILGDLIGVEKSFAPAYAALAKSYLAVGKESVAEFVLRRGLDRVKDDANLLTLMGVLASRARQTEAARGWYDKALASDPGFAPALVNRAALSAQTLEYGAAEEDLLTALARDPLSVDALVALGIVQRRQGNLSGARASFSKGIDLEPTNAAARFNLGVLLADDLKKPAEAMRLFSEVLQTPDVSRELREVAHSYLNDLKQVGKQY
jgi:Tfp pilus assembly protein PilF